VLSLSPLPIIFILSVSSKLFGDSRNSSEVVLNLSDQVVVHLLDNSLVDFHITFLASLDVGFLEVPGNISVKSTRRTINLKFEHGWHVVNLNAKLLLEVFLFLLNVLQGLVVHSLDLSVEDFLVID
jgi:hypothetical protein